MTNIELNELYNEAKILARNNNWSEESYFLNMKIIEYNPRSVSARTRLAKYWIEHGDTEKAESLYREVLDIDPSHEGARNRLNALEREKQKLVEEYNIRLTRQRNKVVQEERTEIENILELLIGKVKAILPNYPNLKSVDNIFNNHHRGDCFDYYDHDEQLFYLLRYFYAYYYEYRELLLYISQRIDELSVCSIGCGSGIDGLALKNIALSECRDYKYMGIDPIDWNERRDILNDNHDRNSFIKCRINIATTDYLKDASILFFPKSLSDISKLDMKDIQNWIISSRIKKERICIAASFTDGNEIFKSEFNQIIGLFNDKGYITVLSNEFSLSEGNIDEVLTNICKATTLRRFFREEMESMCRQYIKDNNHCGGCEFKNEMLWLMQPRLSFSQYNKITFMELGEQ